MSKFSVPDPFKSFQFTSLSYDTLTHQERPPVNYTVDVNIFPGQGPPTSPYFGASSLVTTEDNQEYTTSSVTYLFTQTLWVTSLGN